MARPARVAAGVAALVTLVVLSAGVPIVLWKLAGRPFPSSLPSLHGIARGLSRNQISDSTLVKSAAFIGWVAWLQIAASTVVETIAWIRGRAAPRVRFAGTAQPTICKLLASAAFLVAGAHPNSPHPARLPMRPAATIRAQTPTVWVASVETATHEDVIRPSETPAKSYTVVRYDTLWRIAQTHLGDPLRWRELFALNRGKLQPDDRALEDPQLIMPGWVLTLPDDATGLPPAPELHRSRTTPQHSAPRPAVRSDRPGRGPLPAGRSALPPASTPIPRRAFDHTAVRADVHSHTGDVAAASQLDAALLIGGGLTAASLVVLIDRLRRVQRRRRRVGPHLGSLDPTLDHIERQLRRAADLDGAELLDLALRAFAAATAARGVVPSPILAVRVGGGQVEILSAEPAEQAPTGFVATDDPHGWITDPELSADDLRDVGAGAAAPLPALVALGDLDGDRLLIDIESAGTLTVDGEPQRVAAFIRRVAVELATSLWADHVDVLWVGTWDGDIAAAQRVQQFSDLDSALVELDAVARNVGDALDRAHRARTLAARMAGHPDDGWIPTILVCAEPIGAEALNRVREITGDGGRGAGAVVCSDVRSVWHAALGDTDMHLSPLGLHLGPALFDLPTAVAVDELITDLAAGEPLDEVDGSATDALPTDADVTEPYVDPPFEVEVQVLGPVDVIGSRIALARRDCVELAAYLALHPNGASDERLITVLWPDRAPARSTFNTTVSTTRSRLGRARDGTPHFPRNAASGGTYRLGPLVTTDLARFSARVAHARGCVPSAAIETLRSAMDLVRGKPFEATRGYEWAFSESLIAHIEATIADAAHQLAQRYLDAGDANAAIAVAVEGLVAAPADEVLYRDRMLACDRAGNPAGVETVMDELCEVVATLEPYDDLHPETLALYERLSHRKRARTLPARK
jgi:DNA-binding SARP family transcriptional activator